MNGQPRVLIVDDDPDILEFVSLTLGDEGYDVRTACDGQAALEACAGWQADMILLDLRMPVMDGWQFATAYAARPGPHAAIVVFTAAKDAARLAGEIGAAAHLAKPFALDSLLAVVARYTRPAREEP